MTVISMHSMTVDDARTILRQIGYDDSWSMAELYAALNEPHGLEVADIQTALRVTAAAAAAAGRELEVMASNQPGSPDLFRYCEDRLAALDRGAPLATLSAELGTEGDWRRAAIEHLKAHSGDDETRMVTVSSAALHIVLSRLDELEDGGEPWHPEVAE